MFTSGFPNHYLNTTFDPNPQFSYFPPAASSDHPPGVDPSTHVAPFQYQTPFGQDPNAASHNWLPNPTVPISYQPSIESLNESLLVPNYVWDSNWTNQPQPHQPNVFPGMLNGVDNVGGQEMHGSTSVVAGDSGEELGTKRRKVEKDKYAALSYPKVCEMCNVISYGPEVYRMHLAGKKHAAQANLMHRRAGSKSAPKVHPKSIGILKDPSKAKFPQCVWCEYCKILCNSQDAYGKHIVGKKHQRNLHQLEESKNTGSAPTTIVQSGAKNPQIGPKEKAPSRENLETKMQKVIQGGAAAKEVRTCIVCNVVCNSQIAFNFHRAGQKHAAMVAK